MRILFFFIFVMFYFSVRGQSRDYGKWIDFGSSHVNKWLQIAPGKMGPNALPVPEMDYAKIDTMSSFETGAHAHFMEGDHAVNSYVAFNWCVVPKMVAVKIWGNPGETFQMDNSVRDERQIYYDDTGWMTDRGDLWISTFIQLVQENRKRPDVVLNYSMKTTTGSSKNARYTDAPASYYYGAVAKSFYSENGFLNEIRIGLMAGFYVWQTNKVEMAQDEGPLYEFGIKLKHINWLWSNELGGYLGYDVYKFIGVTGNNDPLIYRTNLTRVGNRFDWKWEYQTGFHDYHYQTFRMSVAYRFQIKKQKEEI